MTRGWARVALIGVLLAAFALRVWRLDAQELRGDEAFGYFFSLSSPQAIVAQTLDLGEPHPVASYWLQHGWLRLAGDSEYALRFLSVGWNTLAVALLAQLAYALGLGAGAMVVGALLLAVSPYALWHAQDARMYSMSLALTVASMVAAVRWWARPSLALAALYIACALLALHTHYYAGFVLAVSALWGLVWCYRQRGRQAAARWLAIQVALALLYLPWAAAALPVVADYGGNGDSPGLGEAVARAWAAMALGEIDLPPRRALWGGLLGVAAVLGFGALYRQGGRPRQAAWLLLLYAGVPLLATWLGARSRPIFDERYLVAVAPPLYLLGAASFDLRRGARSGAWAAVTPAALLALVMAAGTANAYLNPVYSKDRGWRELAQRLDDLSRGVAPTAVRLVQNYPDPTLWYYYRGAVPHLVLPPAAQDVAGAAALVEGMARDGVQRVILVTQPSAGWDAAGIALAQAQARFVPLAETPLGGWTIHLLEQRPPLERVALAYANGLRLVGAAVRPQTVSPGGLLAVHLRLEAEGARLTGSEKLSVQVMDAAGGLIAQKDVPLATAIQATGGVAGYGILMPSSLDAGREITASEITASEITVNLVIYDPAQPGMARVRTVDGREVAALAVLPLAGPVVGPMMGEESDAGTP